MTGRTAEVRVVLTMSIEDANTFVEDWRHDPAAPVLTGGWQENRVNVLNVVVSCSACGAAADDPAGHLLACPVAHAACSHRDGHCAAAPQSAATFAAAANEVPR